MMAQDMSVLVYVNSMKKAEFYLTLLEDHDIIAEIDTDTEEEIAVLVPEEELEDAKHILIQQEEMDDSVDLDDDEKLYSDIDEDDDFTDYSPLEDEEDGEVMDYGGYDDDDGYSDDEELY